MIAWVDSMLRGWARWSLKHELRGIGYPPCSPMFKDTPTSGVFESRVPLGIGASDYKELTDVIMQMPAIPRAVLVVHYQRTHTIRATACACGVSANTVSKYINSAHLFIQERMQLAETH